ncbi:hypothetical protein MOVI109754_14900 [Moritella viscosa]|nr:unnamed protein product [Moritella viscosa]
MSSVSIVTHLVLLLVTYIGIFYRVHQQYPITIGKPFTRDQVLAIKHRFIIYTLLVFGISALVKFPNLYWQG